MASVQAVFSVCNALRMFLRRAYETALPQPAAGCHFDVIAADKLNAAPPKGSQLTIWLYRLTVNEHQRNLTPDAHHPRPPLMLDLHLLLTCWSDDPVTEHALLAWTMRELHQRPVLDNSLLPAEDGWRLGDTVQLMPAELSNEDLMRLWEALAPPYHLSLSYIARMVPIDADQPPVYPPVLERHLSVEEIARP